jgi:SAM-dependent methyltransferase
VHRVSDDWFVGFHQGLAARFWHAAGATMADADVRLIETLLPRGSVLDAPCGDGRIARGLQAAGYDVTGVDISPTALAEAGDLNVLQGDLRDLPELGPFDGAVCWGNSFGYLTPADTKRSLAGFRRVIRPGGTLVLESRVLAETLLPRGVGGHSELTFGGVTMRTTPTYAVRESRLELTYVFEADGVTEHGESAYFVHTVGELVRMLHAAGFADVDLGDYELGATRLIAVAR